MSALSRSRDKIVPMEIINSPTKKNWKKDTWIRGAKKINILSQLNLPTDIPTDDQIINRSKKLEEIFLNQSSDKVDISSILSSFVGILFGILFTTYITTVPQHYPLGVSTYWYEPMFILTLSWCPIAAIHLINVCFFCMGVKVRNTIKTCCIAYLVGATTCFLQSYSIFIFWTNVVELPFPMPFSPYFGAVIAWYSMNLVFWFQCPREWRSNSKSVRKMIFCLLFLSMLYVAEITYKVLRKIFLVVPKDYHLPLVLLLLIVRELHGWSLSYLGKKIAGFPDLNVEIIATLFGGLRHTMFLSVEVGSITTDMVSYIILATDFGINLVSCFLIVWYNRNPTEQNKEKRVSAMLNLIINESVEILLPIAYVICFLMAYLGPNAEIMGNIKNDYWQFIAIDDLGHNLMWLGIMFVVDLGSSVISVFVLWRYCKTNVFKIYLQMQNQIWAILAIEQGYIISEVRKIIINLLFHYSICQIIAIRV